MVIFASHQGVGMLGCMTLRATDHCHELAAEKISISIAFPTDAAWEALAAPGFAASRPPIKQGVRRI